MRKDYIVIKLEEKVSGVSPGFIGLIIAEEDKNKIFLGFLEYLKRNKIKVINNIDCDYLYYTVKRNINHKVSKLFAKYCKESSMAWMIKNDYDDPKSFFNFFGLVSNPKKNYKRTSTYQNTSYAFKSISKYLYGIGKLSYKSTKNKETIREVFAIRLAGIMGFKVPKTEILIKSYKNSSIKLCVMTKWEPKLLARPSKTVTKPGRYSWPLKVFGDPDIIGSEFQNSPLIESSRSAGQTDLFILDSGHAWEKTFLGSNPDIKNIKHFNTNDIEELVGLINIYSPLPCSWLDRDTKIRLDCLKGKLKTYRNGLYNDFIEKTTSAQYSGIVKDLMAYLHDNIPCKFRKEYITYLEGLIDTFRKSAVENIKKSLRKNKILIDELIYSKERPKNTNRPISHKDSNHIKPATKQQQHSSFPENQRNALKACSIFSGAEHYRDVVELTLLPSCSMGG